MSTTSFRSFKKGIVLLGETADASDNIEGSIFQNSSSNRLKTYIQAAVRELITANQTQTLTNKTIDADSNTITNIENADIKSGAAIDATKIADGSVTSTEFQYLDGVTSSIQTQLNSKISNALTSAHLFVGDGSNIATDTAITGDVTISNAGVTAIGANKVANTQLAQMAAHTFKGNNTGSTANALDLTATQATAELNLFTDSLKGLTPLSGGGSTNFLRADGTWAVPSGSAGSYTSSVALDNLGLSVTASAGTITIALKDQAGSDPSGGSPVRIGFRNATASNGLFNLRSITGALSMSLTGAITLGGFSANPYYIYVYAVDNAGTITLGAALALAVDEGSLQSTSTTTTSNAVIYQASALSGKPVRLIGRFLATNTASSWGSPTEVSVFPFITPVISARYASSAGQSIANGATVIVDFGTVTYDTNAAVTTGSSWKFTCPLAGKYEVNTRARWASASFSTNSQQYLYLYKNGSEVSYLDNSTVEVLGTKAFFSTGVDTISLAVGDFIDIRAAHDEATARSFDANSNRVTVAITRVGN